MVARVVDREGGAVCLVNAFHLGQRHGGVVPLLSLPYPPSPKQYVS